MSNIVSREVERYISERSLPGKIGIVRVTGPVANDALYEHPRDPRPLRRQSREQRSRALIGLLWRSAQSVPGVVARLYKSIRRSRSKRRSYKALASLNQSILWDIGIGPRANIPTVVDAAHSQSEHDSGDSPVVHTAVEVWRHEAANELKQREVA